MTVILTKQVEYSVTVNGAIACEHMSYDGARELASRLSGDNDYVDESREVGGKYIDKGSEVVNTVVASKSTSKKKKSKEE